MTQRPDKPVPPLVTLGRIGRVHGIKGWVRLQTFTQQPESLGEHREFQVQTREGQQTLTLDEWVGQGKGLLGHFQGFDSPETARNLTGLELQVPADALPALPDGEFYWHQLEGLLVMNLQDEILGRVAEVMETGANDVLVVHACPGSLDQKERLIPWRPETVVTAVDLEQGIVTVDWQADYLV